jgi:hypothetical protein
MDSMKNQSAQQHLDPPDSPQHLHLFLPPNGIRLLLDAQDCSLELGTEAWEFAVEARCLEAAGLSTTHLRWLLFKGYVQQGAERSRRTDQRRRFHPVPNLSLSAAACFVLTKAGVAYARGVLQQADKTADASDLTLPVWDEASRELRVGHVVVKRFKQPAGNQEIILRVFQE